MTKTIYLFRHGETDWNVERRFQGHTDIPLNAKGRQQAQALIEVMRPLGVQSILSSDLSRAAETARIVTEALNIPLHTTTLLREALLGEPEGQLRDDIVKIYGQEQWQRWLSVHPTDLDFSFPRGETKRQQLERAQKAIEDFVHREPQVETLAVSSHGGTLRRLIHACEGAPWEPISVPNCSLHKIEFGSTLRSWRFLGAVTPPRKDKLFQ